MKTTTKTAKTAKASTKGTKASAKTAKAPAKGSKAPVKGSKAPAKAPAKTAKTAKGPKTPAAPVETSKEPPKAKYTPVALPVHIESSNGMAMDISKKSITLSRGLLEIVFPPNAVHVARADISESNGRKLNYTIVAGSLILKRGNFCITIGPDKTEAYNAILTARDAAKAAKKAKAEGEGARERR